MRSAPCWRIVRVAFDDSQPGVHPFDALPDDGHVHLHIAQAGVEGRDSSAEILRMLCISVRRPECEARINPAMPTPTVNTAAMMATLGPVSHVGRADRIRSSIRPSSLVA